MEMKESIESGDKFTILQEVDPRHGGLTDKTLKDNLYALVVSGITDSASLLKWYRFPPFMLVTIKRLVQRTLAACNSAIQALPLLTIQGDETTVLALSEELVTSKPSQLFVTGDDELQKEMCGAMGQFAGGTSLKLCSPTGDTNTDIALMHNCMALVVGLASGTFADAGVLCLLREAIDKKMIIILVHRGVVFADLFRECPDGLKEMGLMSSIALEWHAGDGGFCDYMQASVKVVIQRLIDEFERRRPAISSSILTCMTQPRAGQLTTDQRARSGTATISPSTASRAGENRVRARENRVRARGYR